MWRVSRRSRLRCRMVDGATHRLTVVFEKKFDAMITIGFFLQNSNLGDADCSELLSGNPGVGGTEYEILLVASELARRYPADFRVVVLTTGSLSRPPKLEFRVVDNMPGSLFRVAVEAGCDVLVLEAKLPLEWYRPKGPASGLKLVAWAHLDSDWRKYCSMSENSSLVRLVCVGREELDTIRDHDIYRKGTFIYYPYAFDEEMVRAIASRAGDRGHRVAFVGSLTPSKGFHILADAWPEVLRRVPDAELHVYGSGKLYHKNAVLGPLGVAEESYEKRFSQPLLQADGTIHHSVHFHGVCHGLAMREQLARAKVGVINPNTDETFGLSAVDLLLAGCHMVVRRSPGVMDTCGYSPFSYAKRSFLPRRIVAALLTEKKPSVEEAIESVNRRFGPDVILPQWRKLLFDVVENRPAEHISGLVHPFYRLKWLRELNRHVRRLVPAFLPVGRWQEILPAVPGLIGELVKRTPKAKGAVK